MNDFVDYMGANHAYFDWHSKQLREVSAFLHSAEAHFLDIQVAETATKLRAALDELRDFMGPVFFSYPARQERGPHYQYAMMPVWNWDRGSPDDAQAAKYHDLVDEMHSLIWRYRDAYKELVAAFHTRLSS